MRASISASTQAKRIRAVVNVGDIPFPLENQMTLLVPQPAGIARIHEGGIQIVNDHMVCMSDRNNRIVFNICQLKHGFSLSDSIKAHYALMMSPLIEGEG
jgi:hypothetical protein